MMAMRWGGSRLCVTATEGGVLRYVLLKGRAVLAEGTASIDRLPRAGEVRVAFLGRGGYFDRVDAEVKSTRMLPFQVRRLIDGALAFNEPFRARFVAADLSGGRRRIALAAVAESDLAIFAADFPRLAGACGHLALVESAIAALVAQETAEPAAVLWRRGSNLLGLLVENGAVLFRVLDRAGGDEESPVRLERMRGSLLSTARRLFPERELALQLYLGDLVGVASGGESADAVSSALLAQLARRFAGAAPRSVLEWPELYGLDAVAHGYNLLDPSVRQRAYATRAAWGLGALCVAGSLALGVLAAARYADWRALDADYAARRSKVESDYGALKPRLPSAAQLAALEQRLAVEGGAGDFRIDALLAWISHITPHGAVIRKLEAGGPAAAGGPAPAPAVSVTATAATAPGAVGAGAGGVLAISVQWELRGDYPGIERLAATLAERLGERARLIGSTLAYAPGDEKSAATFTTVLAPNGGAFRE